MNLNPTRQLPERRRSHAKFHSHQTLLPHVTNTRPPCASATLDRVQQFSAKTLTETRQSPKLPNHPSSSLSETLPVSPSPTICSETLQPEQYHVCPKIYLPPLSSLHVSNHTSQPTQCLPNHPSPSPYLHLCHSPLPYFSPPPPPRPRSSTTEVAAVLGLRFSITFPVSPLLQRFGLFPCFVVSYCFVCVLGTF